METPKPNKNKLNNRVIDVVLAVLLVLVITYEFLNIRLTDNEILAPIVDMTVTRTLAGAFFLIVAIRQGFRLFEFSGKRTLLLIASIFPCFLVVINNFPIIAVAKGEAFVTSPWWYSVIFALECVAIGFFEEVAFRGLLFPWILESRRNGKLSVFLTVAVSSVIFGMYHLFNLIEGAGIVPTMMQVGYSALIGAMCAMVFLQTENIIVPIILHALFDFCGGLIPTLGEGVIWNTPTVIITAVLAVAVFVYMFFVIFMPYDIGRADFFVH